MLSLFRIFGKANYSSLVRQNDKFSTRVGIIGAPLSKGQPKRGVDKAPDALRQYGLISQLEELSLDVKDYGNLEFQDFAESCGNQKLKFPLTVSAACQKVSKAVTKVLLDGRKCITLGGDHSVGMGTIHGHSQAHDVCVLWIDAHADINTTQTSTSGNIHGMPCSFLVKELRKYHRSLQGFEWLNPCLGKSRLAYIGLRDIDPMEKLILTKEDILHFTMQDIDKLGIYKVIHHALEAINPTGKLSLHVSFDIDSLDKMIISSTGTPVMGGLTVREALSIAEEVSNLDIFRAVDIVEINPMLGSQEQVKHALDVGISILKAFLGYSRHGNLPKNTMEIPI